MDRYRFTTIGANYNERQEVRGLGTILGTCTTLLEAQSRRLPEDQRPNQIDTSIRVTSIAFALLSMFSVYDAFSPHPLEFPVNFILRIT